VLGQGEKFALLSALYFINIMKVCWVSNLRTGLHLQENVLYRYYACLSLLAIWIHITDEEELINHKLISSFSYDAVICLVHQWWSSVCVITFWCNWLALVRWGHSLWIKIVYLYHDVVHAACNMTTFLISSPAMTWLLLTSNPPSLLFQPELLNCAIAKKVFHLSWYSRHISLSIPHEINH